MESPKLANLMWYNDYLKNKYADISYDINRFNNNFIKIDNTDVFPFQNEYIIDYQSLNKSVEICIKGKYTAFVVYNNKVYYRKNNFVDCVNNIKYSKNASYSVLVLPEDFKNEILSKKKRIDYYTDCILNIKSKFNYQNSVDKLKKYIENKKNFNFEEKHQTKKVQYITPDPVSPLHYKYNHAVYLLSFLNLMTNNNNFKFNYTCSDVNTPLYNPTFCHSRPINNNGENVLLPLTELWMMTERIHEIKDDIPFKNKINSICWRGTNSGDDITSNLRNIRAQRITMVEKCYNSKSMDIGFSDMRYNKKSKLNYDYIKSFKSLKDQLKYKFIMCVEGNDVASNLAWVLLSNSIPICPKHYIESWFCEGKLEPWKHYVPVKNDFSDLEDNYNKCLNDNNLCNKIILYSKLFAFQYMDREREFEIIKNVIEIYKTTN